MAAQVHRYWRLLIVSAHFGRTTSTASPASESRSPLRSRTMVPFSISSSLSIVPLVLSFMRYQCLPLRMIKQCSGDILCLVSRMTRSHAPFGGPRAPIFISSLSNGKTFSGIECNVRSPDPSTACTLVTGIDHIGAGRTLLPPSHTADICRFRSADQDAQTTPVHQTAIKAPDTSRNRRNDGTHQPSNSVGRKPCGRNAGTGNQCTSADGDTARNAPGALGGVGL